MYKDRQGRYRTQSLFKETYIPITDYPPVYTLHDVDPEYTKDLPSFKQLFMETNDITGYTLAMQELESWDHFQKLLSSDWFQKYWTKWTAEMEVKLRAEGLLKIRETSQGSTSSAYQAAKYLSDKGWEPKRGRPTKAEKEKHLRKEKALEEALSDDMNRITQLRVV